MLDMTPIGQAVLVYAVLAAGLLALVLTSVAQLRELPAAFRTGQSASLVRRGFLAASVGMGSVGGSILALEIGGPGAIGWMWIASLLGMGLVYAELKFSLHYRREVDGKRRAATVYALADGVPVVGQTLAIMFALAFVVFAVAAGSLLQTQQSSELLATFGANRWLVVVFLVIAAGIGIAVPKLRTFIVALGPVAVVLYVIAMSWVIMRAPGSAGPALGQMFAGITQPASGELAGGAAGATVLMAMQAGFLRATLATEAGLGSSGFTPQADRIVHPERAAAAAMLAPLISGILVPTLTALGALTATPWVGQRIDEPAERLAAPSGRQAGDTELKELAEVLSEGDLETLAPVDRARVVALWAPLERPQARGTAASLQAGQTVVLPLDAVVPEGAPVGAEGLRKDHVYPMVMRASPRGMKMKIAEGQRSLVMALSETSEVVTEVVFRDRDSDRAAFAAYDTRIAVTNEVFGPPGRQGVRLTPKDSSIDLYRLSKRKDGPYVVLGDLHFRGRVVQMFQTRWGLHHAVIEADADLDSPLNLRAAVSSGGFRGPYLDSGEPRGPRAMIAREAFDAPVGARLRVEYRSPSRGMDFGHLLTSGELLTPPWSFLAQTEFAIIRHDEDPALDMRIPVTSKLVDGTLRFVSARKDIADFAKVDRWRDYSGPYLDPPAYSFEVEVHTGARAPASSTHLGRLGLDRRFLSGPFSERRTLVAVHPQGEAQGSRGELYDPHPAEVAPFMDGPWVAGSGIERVGWASRLAIERGGDLLLAISILILALTTMIAWAGYGARAADFLMGRGGGIGFVCVFLVAGLAGAVLPILPILTLADHAMLALVLLHGIGLAVLLIRKKTS